MRLGTGETLAFVERWLAPGTSVLEIGCGDGELAAALTARGHPVTAIDSDPAMVAEARRLGVVAEVATWPFWSAAAHRRFDSILFTRSLHHISPLDEAVKAAREVASQIHIEDFALTEVSADFVSWLRSEVSDWEPHDVHPFARVRDEVSRRFRIVHEESVPYCYRYFDPPDDRRIYEAEIARGELLGRRLVGVA